MSFTQIILRSMVYFRSLHHNNLESLRDHSLLYIVLFIHAGNSIWICKNNSKAICWMDEVKHIK